MNFERYLTDYIIFSPTPVYLIAPYVNYGWTHAANGSGGGGSVWDYGHWATDGQMSLPTQWRLTGAVPWYWLTVWVNGNHRDYNPIHFPRRGGARVEKYFEHAFEYYPKIINLYNQPMSKDSILIKFTKDIYSNFASLKSYIHKRLIYLPSNMLSAETLVKNNIEKF